MKEIKLTQGKFAIVDDQDFSYLSLLKWQYGCKGYAVHKYQASNGKIKQVFMHRIILKNNGKKLTDHINGNTLDNRRINLRKCSNAQNQHNSNKHVDNKSGYKGVFWMKSKNKWYARISVNGKRLFFGYFENIVDAVLAYNQAALKYFGEYARLNIL